MTRALVIPSARSTGWILAMMAMVSGTLGWQPAARAAAPRSVRARSYRGDASQYDWPELHQGPQLNGYAANSPLSVGNASQLGVRWASKLYGAALDSPVVAYDATLNMTLAYIGTETGYFYAVDLATGTVEWGDRLGAPVRGTAVVSGNTVYVVTALTPRIYALNATTGATICSLLSVNSIEASPTVATPPGGVPTVYIGVEDGVRPGPLIAMNAATCAVDWQFTGYRQVSGEWDPISYALDATGEPLVMFGTADPDSTVYALDAVSGKLVWEFEAYNPPPRVYDVGTGVVVSPPGVNGFADGVAYVTTRYGELYALDLTTGAEIWSYVFDLEPGSETGISTIALDGTNLVFGRAPGVDDVNAVTGALVWSNSKPSCDVDSSPAIAGASGSEVVAFGDLCGNFRVVSLATGTSLYSYKTGGYITSSPAVSDGDVLIASDDGFLYDFSLGGGNEPVLPVTAISAPADGSVLPNPGGSVSISGTATDSTGLAAVDVAIQSSGPEGPWWDAATGTWVPAPVANPAQLGSPGATSSPWTISLPVAAAGGAFEVVADAVSVTGQPDVHGASSSFTATYAKTGPYLILSSGYVAPGGVVYARGGGFAKGEQVAVSLLGVTLATATTSATSGSFSRLKVTIPATTAFGTVSLVATGVTSGKSSSAAVYVTNAWTQAGYDSAHTGFEPNDAVLRDLVHPGANLFLDPAWVVDAGSPLEPPVVLDSVVYVGDEAGQVFAIATRSGSVLWTWQDSTGAAIDGSLAVDPTSHLVFAGAADGNLYALSATTGTLVWSAAVGGSVNPPVTEPGTVFASSSTGVVEAIVSKSGTPIWSVNLGSGAGTPALDTVRKLLVVGDAAGSVVELSAKTGASGWSYAVGGSSLTTPLLFGQDVYVGGVGTVDALSETTGTPVWSVALETGDTASVTAVNGKMIVVGTTGGYLNFLSLATGAPALKTNSYPSAIVGLATTETIDIAQLANGSIEMFRSWGNRDFVWDGNTGAGSTSPIVVNGTVFVGAGDDDLYAFTPAGDTPL